MAETTSSFDLPGDLASRVSPYSDLPRQIALLQGRLDTLISLKQADNTQFNELNRHLTTGLQQINDTLTKVQSQLSTQDNELLAQKRQIETISHIVRDSNNDSLVHRVAQLEQGLNDMRSERHADRANVANAHENINDRLSELRIEIRESNKELKGSLENYTHEHQQRYASLSKERRNQSHTLFALILGGFMLPVVLAILRHFFPFL